MSNKNNEKEIVDDFNEIEKEIDETKEEINEPENSINNEENDGKEEDSDEVAKLKDMLARVNADYQNFKVRTQRDKDDMIFFLKQDIFKKILPRIDDLERIIKNTPENQRDTSIYIAVMAMEKVFKKDLENMWLSEIKSIWEEVDLNKHEVMTQVPSDKSWIIVDEFEKWYMIWDRVLRIAKVIVWV